MTALACAAGCGAGARDTQRADWNVVPTHTLVLPSIHCAGCINGVERALSARPDIFSARVNLTKKRVAISAAPDADPTQWITTLHQAGFEAHEAHDGTSAPAPVADNLLLHMGVAGFAMMNVMLLSVAVWSGAADSTRDFLHWISAAIALPAAAFAAQPFFRSAWSALRVGRLNMDVPISLAILLACGMSLYEVAHGGAHAWFDAALSLTFFLLAGRVLDQRLRRAARSAADNLAALEPARVTLMEGTSRVSRLIGDVVVGDRLWLAAGGRVPVDATLTEGSAQVDRSAITGESAPVTCSKDDPLYAGDVLLDGPHTLWATRVGDDTSLRRIAQLVATAEASRGTFRSLADRAAAIYTPAVHVISFAAFSGWLVATGDIRAALNVAIATLIITCPCALGLAVPAVGVAATSRLFRNGLLVKSDTTLERLATIDNVVFDKTGTLTQRRLNVPPALTPPELAVLKALADTSDHPLSKDLSSRLSDVEPAALRDAREEASKGVFAHWDDLPVFLGRADGCGPTIFRLGQTTHRFAADEQLLPGVADTVAQLAQAGFPVSIITGDTHDNAKAIASDLGVDSFTANLTPEDKITVVSDLKALGAKVLMIGDGLNDTAALAAAHASIAPSQALAASRNAADINIISGDMTKVTEALRTSRMARRRILENFAIAALYNAIAIPIAVSGFATPLAAAIAMSTSSITVILNSQRGLR